MRTKLCHLLQDACLPLAKSVAIGCVVFAAGYSGAASAQHFSPAERWSSEYGYNHGWRMSRHIRLLANVTGSIKKDIVAFGDDGVYVSKSQYQRHENGSGRFMPSIRWAKDFGYKQGWRVRENPRFVKDMNGDGWADIIGFGNDGVYVALNERGVSFAPKRLWSTYFAPEAGGWITGRHERQLADWNNDGRPDIVGFGEDGIYVALNLGDRFSPPMRVHAGFGYNEGWRVGKHPRFITQCGRSACVFGFHDAWVYRSWDLDHIRPPISPSLLTLPWGLNGLGYAARNNQFGLGSNIYPRTIADLGVRTGSGKMVPKIVGFGRTGVFVNRNNLETDQWSSDFGKDQGWSIHKHIRLVIDVNFGDRRADIIGFGEDGVYLAINNGGRFGPARKVVSDFSYKQGWFPTSHPRMLADVAGLHPDSVDIVGFGPDGVYVSQGSSRPR